MDQANIAKRGIRPDTASLYRLKIDRLNADSQRDPEECLKASFLWMSHARLPPRILYHIRQARALSYDSLERLEEAEAEVVLAIDHLVSCRPPMPRPGIWLCVKWALVMLQRIG